MTDEAVAGLPRDVIDVRTRSETLPTGAEVRTTTIHVDDPAALDGLDLNRLRAQAGPDAAKLGALVKRVGAFSPEVLDQTTNFLPAGMVSIGIDAPRMADNNNQGINFQFRFLKLANGEFWPTPIENIG
jgi:hypothetical protein